MRVETFKSFVIGAISCFDFWEIKDLKPQKANVRPNLFSIQGVAVIIGVVGDFRGQIIYCFDKDLVWKTASKMCGFELKLFDEIVFSAIGEVANIISGKAISLLKSSGGRLDITPPTIIQTTQTIVSMKTPILCIPFQKDNKVVFEINYSFEN